MRLASGSNGSPLLYHRFDYVQNIILFDLSGDFVKCVLKEGRNYFLQFWLHIFCTLFKTYRQFAQQNKNAR